MLGLAPILASGVFVARSIAVRRRRRDDIDAPEYVDGDDSDDENDALDGGDEAVGRLFQSRETRRRRTTTTQWTRKR
jgi:hypothetical protein